MSVAIFFIEASDLDGALGPNAKQALSLSLGPAPASEVEVKNALLRAFSKHCAPAVITNWDGLADTLGDLNAARTVFILREGVALFRAGPRAMGTLLEVIQTAESYQRSQGRELSLAIVW
jgi:hypothetical protein